MKINVATDEGNSWNGIGHWTNDETGVAVPTWLWIRVESWPASSVGWSVWTELDIYV